MSQVTGSLAIRCAENWYIIQADSNGWIAAELVQFLEDAHQTQNPKNVILKLLGYTMLIAAEPPPRRADHWVEVDLESRRLSTNSELIRKAVKQTPPSSEDPFHDVTLDRIYRYLDTYDYSVDLYK
jgi:hypothetical protein